MTEATIIRENTELQSDLFLINGGVPHGVTSLFLRAKESTRTELVGAVGIIKESAKEHEWRCEMGLDKKRCRDYVSDDVLMKLCEAYPLLSEDYYFVCFRQELANINSQDLEVIEDEFRKIISGEIVLKEAEKQQMSNLSDAGMSQYLETFGIEVPDLSFPLLDVGTGENAHFALDVLRKFPNQRVVSTSMHLVDPNSVMSKVLEGKTDRGELVASDGLDTPFDDETFSTIVSLNADPFYVAKADLLPSLREKHRVLKLGGTAILCPAVCDYGKHDITADDLAPIADEVDISFRSIPENALQYYSGGIDSMLVINK